MTQRRWDEMQDLRKEAKGWMADLDSRENALKAELMELLNKDRKPETKPSAAERKRQGQEGAAAKKPADCRGEEADPPVAAKPQRPKPRKKSKATEPPTAPVVVVDFSPLAEDHAAAGPFAPSPNPLAWKRTSNWPCF